MTFRRILLALALVATAASTPQQADAANELDAYYATDSAFALSYFALVNEGFFFTNWEDWNDAYVNAFLGDWYADFAFENGLDTFFLDAYFYCFDATDQLGVLYFTAGQGGDLTYFAWFMNSYASVYCYNAWAT